jgi:hypothetical protein
MEEKKQASAEERNARWAAVYAPTLIALFAVLIRAAIALATRRTAEDALITLRYAENLAAGHGFVYNVGERVLGTTTPLYTLLLAPAAWLFGPGVAPNVWGKLLNILADGGTCILLCLWMRQLGRPKIGWLAALLYALDPRAVNWNSSGMETGLVTLAGVAALTAFVCNRPLWMATALAGLTLLRPDGLLLTGVLGIALTIKDRRLPTAAFVLFLALTLPWILFAWRYFGSPVPTSIQAKFIIYPRFAEGLFPQFGAFLRQMFASGQDFVFAAAFLAGGWSVFRNERRLLPAFLWAILYFGLFATSKLILFGWYLVPPLPVVYAVGALALAEGARRVRHSAPRLSPLLPIACGVLIFASVLTLPRLTLWLRQVQANEDRNRKTVGLWIRQNTPPDETLMVESIGYIGYYSQRPILDAAGLVSPQTLPSYRRGIACPLWDILKRFAPPRALLYRQEYDWVRDSAEREGRPLDQDYRIVQAWLTHADFAGPMDFILLQRPVKGGK